MGAMGKIGRRAFLVASAAVAGGVAFGVYVVSRPHANPLLAELGEGEATFNAWVKIGPSGVTLIAPHTDLGQGARHVQAALIAEEMDLDWGQFSVEPGPPAPAYWNRAIGEEGADIPSKSDGPAQGSSGGLMGMAFRVLGMQITGGSSTVADSFEKLRIAGAVARETLKLAAARRAGLDVALLKTAHGAVILPDGAEIGYGALAEDAAKIAPVQDVALREPSQWRLLGKPMARLDIIAKSTGTQSYGIDLVQEGMAFATVRLNPRKGGALLGYDASGAEGMPGVKKILPVTNGVAVVADNTWNAFQAANAITCEWGPAPYPAQTDQHWQALAAALTNGELDKEWRHDGDVGAALGGAGDAVTAEYRAPYLAHAPLEPLNALILVGEDRVDLWVSHQIPRIAQQMTAKITGVPEARVHVHNQYAGGSFGHRLEFENVRYAAEIGKAMQGAPIKLTFSREEDFAQDFPRPIALCRISGKVADGRVAALDIAVATPNVGASQGARMGLAQPGPDSQAVAGIWNAPYAIPNLRVRNFKVEGLSPTSSWRSVGASFGGFFIEQALDELIHAAGADPLAERLRLCNSDVARGVLEAVGDMSNWGAPMDAGRGRGLALVVSFGTPVAEVVEVTATPQGIRIDAVYVAADVGQVLDPINFDNQVKGAVVWGLGHAMNCEITYADGMAEQTNYHMHAGMRFNQCPRIEVRGLTQRSAISGIGEPPVPPAAPALANAIFAATGQRLREMPFSKFVTFV